jgi:hypothetical protein
MARRWWRPRWRLDRQLVLERLDEVELGKDRSAEDAAWLETMRLAPNLLLLAQIDYEREYSLCRLVEPRLGPEPYRL